MKKVLFICILIFSALFYSCEKYEMIIPSSDLPDPIPDTVYVPDNSWIGNQMFFAKADNNSLLLLFCNSYVNGPSGMPFYEYKIGDGPWSAPIMQATPFAGHNNWGLGTVPVSIITPETALVYVRFGLGSTYANIQTSMFNVGGVITFGLPMIEH